MHFGKGDIMKKTLCITLCMALITFLVSGCTASKIKDPDSTLGNLIPENAASAENQNPGECELTQTQQITFEYQRIDTKGRDSLFDETPSIYTVRSAAELDAYCNQNADILNSNFLNAVAVYDNGFFSEHALLLLPLGAGTCSERQEVKQLLKQTDGSYTLYMDRITPEVVSDATGFWHIIVAVDDCIEEDAQVTLETNHINEGLIE